MDIKENAINLTIQSSEILQLVQLNNQSQLLQSLTELEKIIHDMKEMIEVKEEKEVILPKRSIQDPSNIKGVIYRQTTTGNVDIIIPEILDDHRLLYGLYKDHDKQVDLVYGDEITILIQSSNSYSINIDKDNTKVFNECISLEMFIDQFDDYYCDEKIIQYLNNKAIQYTRGEYEI